MGKAIVDERLKLATASVLFALAGAFAVQLGFWVLGDAAGPTRAQAAHENKTPLRAAAALR
jgi:hypothetical protein